ncbi:hypothetical protein [Sphingosinicella terrae]|uniref:hypothetical protein n=1 Tax=Sphingosinicella terrae TaxID=2172047 RepID=UPI000E0DDD8D|nr:hypothetical protein [Sphingosinicella terrae]
MRGIAAAAVLMLVAGCGAGDADNVPAPAGAASNVAQAGDAATGSPDPALRAPSAATLVTLDPEGVRLVDADSGAARLLAFGTPQAQAVEALGRAFGAQPSEQAVNEECGAGPILHVEWANGFTGLFEEESFRGWFVGERGLSTADGIGIGTARGQAEASRTLEVEPSSLGTEFRSGDLGGLFGSAAPDAPVSALWAGLTCLFR